MESPLPPASAIEVEPDGHFAAIVDQVAATQERVLLTRGGQSLAALVPLADVAALEAFEDARDAAEIRSRLAEWQAAGAATVPLAEVARRLGVEIGEANA